jgi:hypothetical protein
MQDARFRDSSDQRCTQSDVLRDHRTGRKKVMMAVESTECVCPFTPAVQLMVAVTCH